MSAAVSPELLAIIVCPDCKGELTLSEVPDLTCGGCGLVYPVRDGIPVLLVDEARKPA
ncbi:Trm112 family protein [Nocardioides albidus]|uniref:UPF0434 protein FHP29_06930 n=1 Tax=Nocardioides albidus TaxID=1517589 RepID=A0A5C4W5I2_9ACTN|nr:Trm112 family protein [Nocardioides albidus]TNM42739.1 Trm112 family protein [Nocardioides albidus]